MMPVIQWIKDSHLWLPNRTNRVPKGWINDFFPLQAKFHPNPQLWQKWNFHWDPMNCFTSHRKKSIEIEAPAIQTGADRFPSHDRWLPPVSPWPSLPWPAGPGRKKGWDLGTMGKSWEHRGSITRKLIKPIPKIVIELTENTDVPDVPSWQFTNQCHFYCPPPLPPHHHHHPPLPPHHHQQQ